MAAENLIALDAKRCEPTSQHAQKAPRIPESSQRRRRLGPAGAFEADQSIALQSENWPGRRLQVHAERYEFLQAADWLLRQAVRPHGRQARPD